MALTQVDGGMLSPINGQFYGMKSRIINGAMVIDQRNAGASVTQSSGGYTLDRWQSVMSVGSKFSVQQNSGSVTPPAGYKYYLGVTSTSAYSVGAADYFDITQNIEGYNWADLGFGAAGASSVTFSFWVRSSLTGTFSGTLTNSNDTQVYPFSYTISAANTWEQKSITIAGSTSGTWNTTNGVGAKIQFALGLGSNYLGTLTNTWNAGTLYGPTGQVNVVATNGATFYITGVQLEKGSTATSFDYRPYGTELALCQRYYATGNYPVMRNFTGTTIAVSTSVTLPVTMRATPTVTASVGTVETAYSNVISSYQSSIGSGASTVTSTYTAAIEL